MKALTTILSLLVLISFTACDGKKNTNSNQTTTTNSTVDSDSPAYDYYNRIFMPDKDNIFRSVAFDQSFEEVKQSEATLNQLQLAESKKDFLQYEKDLFTDTAKGIDYAMLKYIFDNEDRLWIITVNYYIQDSSRTNDLFDLLNEQFNEQYGDYYIDSDGYTVWEASYQRADSTDVVYDLGIRKLIKFEDPGIQIELMRFGKL